MTTSNKKSDIKESVVVIAGEGMLPKQVYDSCRKQKIPCLVLCMKGYGDEGLFAPEHCKTFYMGSISKILKEIHDFGAKKVVLAGKVKRIKLSKLLMDLKGAKLFTRLIRAGLADNSILQTVVDFLKDEGIKVVPADSLVCDMFADKGCMTKVQPNDNELKDITAGKKILKDISKHDMGQGLVIQSGLILGVEAAEGTDELVARCGAIQQKIEERPVLIKLMKTNQNKNVDVPCIGVETINNLHKSNIAGVAIEAGKTYILDRKATVALANKLKVFIYGF